MRIPLDLNSLDSYQMFLRIKELPAYRFVGREAIVADEYAARLGIALPHVEHDPYIASSHCFDYQKFVADLAIRKRKFALFMECGMGKSVVYFEYIKYLNQIMPKGRAILVVSPLMIIDQTVSELHRFYGDTVPMEVIPSRDVPSWVASGSGRVGITNYESFNNDVDAGRLFGLVLDESSMLAGTYGRWGQELIRIGKGLEWKLAGTGTPAPNDRIEYANHAVFLDAFPNVNSFYARYFVNKGQKENRWEMKPHALGSFYRELSHWSIFLTNPGTYGFKDNAGTLPPIHIHVHDIDLTEEQNQAAQKVTGQLIVTHLGGIVSRSKLSRISRGDHDGEDIPTNKVRMIQEMVGSWMNRESTIIWCRFNAEQDAMERAFPGAASIRGTTPYEDRVRCIADFQSGRNRILIGKPKMIGLGLNLQIATRQVFSGISDSWLDFHQAIKRSNRVGSKFDLNVHVPVTPLEHPMAENVFRKAARIDEDTAVQERMFLNAFALHDLHALHS